MPSELPSRPRMILDNPCPVVRYVQTGKIVGDFGSFPSINQHHRHTRKEIDGSGSYLNPTTDGEEEEEDKERIWEIAYVIHKDWRGKGLATALVQTYFNWANWAGIQIVIAVSHC